MTRPSGVVSRHKNVAWVEGESRIVVVRLHDLAAPPVLLAGSAAEIWRLLADTRDTHELVQLVAHYYDADPGVVEEDVLAWLDGAQRLGIISRLE